ncbi:hypothetical protein E2C01_100035 [Portunus trituberculatus]|uniref:Uncharacterized protein n=1 Tax=Portunus trituberculatus TaxID=210409 RepID=A0A5B7KC98_PORTR|nr:hypothetical protein [Portunus trituberculatus]
MGHAPPMNTCNCCVVFGGRDRRLRGGERVYSCSGWAGREGDKSKEEGKDTNERSNRETVRRDKRQCVYKERKVLEIKWNEWHGRNERETTPVEFVSRGRRG